jgi:adhesin/invasin
MNMNSPVSISRRFKIFCWINIITQLLIPVTATITPAVAASPERFLPQAKSTHTVATRIYVLAKDETPVSVAAKYNMTPEALRELNRFRTFARGYDGLREGDELEVPATPLAAFSWENDATAVSGASVDGQLTQKVAGFATQTGGFLSGRPDGSTAASVARGMAAGEAGGRAQDWLSQFGTARVQLDVNEKFSLKNSQFDLLVPLSDTQKRLIFTQGSLHRTDERTQTNVGSGIRFFEGNFMAGANAFMDYDLSRDHARAGLGLEYWRDNLKLTANNYLRMTGWKASPDVEDYDERPADGWDVRAEAWLPAYPQLGGKLMYEQYYGQEVALFGRDNRQKNPRAVTAAATWTPLPLITFSAEQRQGQGGVNDSRIGLQVNWRPGVPLRQQTDPDMVASMRSLAGSRYDLVERNNNIVLDYRKQETISLRTVGQVTGFAGGQKSLDVAVTSKHGLERTGADKRRWEDYYRVWRDP